jgi:hypothetical protein
MHVRTARLMAARCETCLKTLRQTVGEEPLRGTVMYKPDQEFDASHTLDLIGRSVRVEYFGHSSGPGDVAVLDERAAVFGSRLSMRKRVPDIRTATCPAGRSAQAMRSLQVVRWCRAWPRLNIPADRRWTATSRSSRTGANPGQLGRVMLDGRCGRLPGTSLGPVHIVHRRNASIAFLRFERELMFK